MLQTRIAFALVKISLVACAKDTKTGWDVKKNYIFAKNNSIFMTYRILKYIFVKTYLYSNKLQGEAAALFFLPVFKYFPINTESPANRTF